MSDTHVCYCGHVEDEHGSDPDYPGSTVCTIEGCDCVAFDHDSEATAVIKAGEDHG